jgi:broad specificity phosphatase PhoE
VDSLHLFLIRHAESEFSRARRFTGRRDVGLTDEGRRQAEALARALSPVSLAAVYASPLVRSLETAEAIARPHGLPVRVEPAFSEMAFGEWEGLTREEARSGFPELYECWRRTPGQIVCPGGEAMTDVAARVAGALDALRAAHAGATVAVVTHAIVVRVVILAALGLDLDRIWAVDASPAGITEIEYRGDWATLHRVNTLAHLDPPLAAEPSAAAAEEAPRA